MLPALYRVATGAASPLVRAYLQHRRRAGKEDARRLDERFGHACRPRPAGRLVWLHAASVGEAMSVLALVEAIVSARPRLSVLLTTGTVAAARLLEPRLPPRAVHQYVPVDLPAAVERFLDHWRPDLAVWVESELWPNLVLATRRRRIPMVLVNGRLSARSYARWRAWPGLGGPVVSAFALCLAQDSDQAERFRRLGASRVIAAGDLKAAAEPLPADRKTLAELRRQTGSRPVWLAASTHPGEDEIVAEAHARLAPEYPDLLTIIAPRHPSRGPDIATMIRGRGIRTARRGAGEPTTPETGIPETGISEIGIYVADTIGELGVFYRLAEIAFIGGSLVEKGGHNPFEAARLDCAILHGPDTHNCAAMSDALAVAGASEAVADAGGLARAVDRLLRDPDERARRAARAFAVAEAGRGVLDTVLQHLAPWLDALSPASQEPLRSASAPGRVAESVDAGA